MLVNSSLAILPKARGILARRITATEYSELMRRRTVPEVARALKAHPFFADSLKTLSDTNPHRSQLEDLLSRDIYFKFENLIRYGSSINSFAKFFIIGCEVDELLEKIRLLSINRRDAYITRLPTFLVGDVSYSLMELAKAHSYDECIKVVKGTPYAHILENHQGERINYLVIEKELRTYYYEQVFKLIEQNTSGTEYTRLKEMFEIEAEVYNLDLIFRVKSFFSKSFTTDNIMDLLLPFTCSISKKSMHFLADSQDFEELSKRYNDLTAKKKYGAVIEDEGFVYAKQTLHKKAFMILRFSINPCSALAAALAIAKMQRTNVINIIEGVRYSLPPEQIERLLQI